MECVCVYIYVWVCVCVCVYIHTQIYIYIYIYLFINFKELALATMEAKSKIFRVDQYAGDPGKRLFYSSKPKVFCCQNSLFLRGGQSLF